MSCTTGNSIDMTISMGLRLNLRSSRSITAQVLCMPLALSPEPLALRPPDHERAVLRVRVLQRIAQRAARVVDEHIVERRALDAKRLDIDMCTLGAFHERERGRRTVGRGHTEDVLVPCDILDPRQRP